MLPAPGLPLTWPFFKCVSSFGGDCSQNCRAEIFRSERQKDMTYAMINRHPDREIVENIWAISLPIMTMQHIRESPSASHAMRMNGWNDFDQNAFSTCLDPIYHKFKRHGYFTHIHPYLSFPVVMIDVSVSFDLGDL